MKKPFSRLILGLAAASVLLYALLLLGLNWKIEEKVVYADGRVRVHSATGAG